MRLANADAHPPHCACNPCGVERKRKRGEAELETEFEHLRREAKGETERYKGASKYYKAQQVDTEELAPIDRDAVVQQLKLAEDDPVRARLYHMDRSPNMLPHPELASLQEAALRRLDSLSSGLDEAQIESINLYNEGFQENVEWMRRGLPKRSPRFPPEQMLEAGDRQYGMEGDRFYGAGERSPEYKVHPNGQSMLDDEGDPIRIHRLASGAAGLMDRLNGGKGLH